MNINWKTGIRPSSNLMKASLKENDAYAASPNNTPRWAFVIPSLPD